MSAASCSKVMVSEWQDGRVGFLFLLQGKGEDSVFIYAFIGNGPEQIQKIANAAIQPINHVNVTFDGETSTHIAVGACEFDKPFNRSEVRRGGKEDGSKCQTRGRHYVKKKKRF